jgi:hypothetical protein
LSPLLTGIKGWQKAVALSGRADPAVHFYIDPTATDLGLVVPYLAASEFFQLPAERQAGKTAHALAVARALEELGFQTVYVSLNLVSTATGGGGWGGWVR